MATPNPYASPATDDDSSDYFAPNFCRIGYGQLWGYFYSSPAWLLRATWAKVFGRRLRTNYGLALHRLTLTELNALPDWVAGAIEPAVSQAESLGYSGRVAFYYPTVGFYAYWTTLYADATRTRLCSIVCQRVFKTLDVHFSIDSRLASGCTIVTANWSYQFELPPGYQLTHHPDASLVELDVLHQQWLSQLGHDPPVAFDDDELASLIREREAYETDYVLSSGLWQPLPQEEVLRLRAATP